MISLPRRTLLKIIGLTVGTVPALAAVDPSRYNSGYPKVDAGVKGVLNFLSHLFRLQGDWVPDFSFFDDGDKPNSYARDPIDGYRRPHVLIGRGAVVETMRVGHGDFGGALTALMAHEFAHVYQLKAGHRSSLIANDRNDSHRLIETHADFLAGWALPQAWWIEKISDLRVAADQFYALGDIQLTNHVDHGSRLQRQTILSAGYTWGLASPNDPDKAAVRGLEVLKDLFPQWFRSL